MFGCQWFCYVLCIFGTVWVVVSAAFFVSRGSEHVEYHSKKFQTWGKPHGMALHWALFWKCFQPCIFPVYFLNFLLARSMCVYVWLSLVLSCCPFFFWAVWVAVPNGIPLGSLLEAFPSLHSSFLFLPPSFQQEACIYVLLAVVCGTLRGKWLIYLIEKNA